jgi:hypothetical protein
MVLPERSVVGVSSQANTRRRKLALKPRRLRRHRAPARSIVTHEGRTTLDSGTSCLFEDFTCAPGRPIRGGRSSEFL